MSEPKDPEQLLADALRAQAVFAPQASQASPPPSQSPPSSPPEPVRMSAQLPAYWILMLAVLLGLAAGSVVGLLTLV